MKYQDVILIFKSDNGVEGWSFSIEKDDLDLICNKYQMDGCSLCADTLNEVLEDLKED